MLFENFAENVRYSEHNEEFDSFRSQQNNFDELNLERFMFNFINQKNQNSKNQNSEASSSQNQDSRSNSMFNDRRSEFHKFFFKDLSSAETSFNEFVNGNRK
jgi:hypothetical protein